MTFAVLLGPRVSVSFALLAGFQSAGIAPSLTSLFSSRLLRSLGAGTSVASMI